MPVCGPFGGAAPEAPPPQQRSRNDATRRTSTWQWSSNSDCVCRKPKEPVDVMVIDKIEKAIRKLNVVCLARWWHGLQPVISV